MKKLVYVAGSYRGDKKKNIENAEKKSIELIRRGFDVLTPHKNSAGYEKYEDESITHKTWLDMGLNLLSRCDVLYVMKNAESSEGTQAEIAFAFKHNILVIREMQINPDKRATALAIIKAEYAEHGYKTKRSVRVAVENGIKRKARNRAIMEGFRIYEKRHPEIVFRSIK